MSEGFLARWSRRKQAATQGETVEETPVAPVAEQPAAPAPAAPAGEAPPAQAEQSSEAEFDLSSLPPIESLTAESDLSLFLRKGVPDSLRHAALRRAWSLDPAIRDFIGPADYAWDFNAPDGVPGFAPTLGGDVAKLLAQAIGLERDAEAATATAADGATPATAAHPAPEAVDTPTPQPAQDATQEIAATTTPATPGTEAPAVPEPASPAPPRRHGSATPA